MSYYIGHRHGWVYFLGIEVCWHDPKLYPYLAGRSVGAWKVWIR